MGLRRNFVLLLGWFVKKFDGLVDVSGQMRDIGSGARRHIDGRTDLLLGQISLFPQVADPLVFYHYDHPRDSIGVNKLFYL